MEVIVPGHAWLDCVQRETCFPFPFAWAVSQLPTNTQSSSCCPNDPIHPDKAGMTREGLVRQLCSVAPMSLACMTFQLVLEHGLWEGMIRRQGGEELFVSYSTHGSGRNKLNDLKKKQNKPKP